jgi:hypothetical protein
MTETCSICLNCIRCTRSTRRLSCTHMYHAKCLTGWEKTGGNTCPICRTAFESTIQVKKSLFKITIIIENTSIEQNSTLELSDEQIINFMRSINIQPSDLTNYITELELEVDTNEHVTSFLNELGLERTSFNPAIFNTE